MTGLDEAVLRKLNGKSGLRYLVIVGCWLLLCGLGSRAAAQVQVGDNLYLNAQGELDLGYSGNYGDNVPSDHGILFGGNGTTNGYYYNPNFINFAISPYYNQSRDNSSFQSLTNASGVAATANIFPTSHFPGSVSYQYNYNSTGTLGLVGTPNFTTVGNSQGFGIGWGVLFAGWPTLSVGYQQGSGSGNLYGTDQQTSSNNRNFNVHSSYSVDKFLLNTYYDRIFFNSYLPEFLSGSTVSQTNDSSSNDFGLSASRSLPVMNGQFYSNYDRSDITSNYLLAGTGNTSDSFTTDTQTAGVNFHPTNKFGFSFDETYINNLSGYLDQELINNGSSTTPVQLGVGSHSLTFGGGASYTFTNSLAGAAQATYYDQSYYGNSYTGTYISGTLFYTKRLWDMFSFWASVVDSDSGMESNNVGFIGNVNFFKRVHNWDVGGNFNYAQNVQSILITYTTSYYNYSANIHHRLGRGWQWTAAFNGTHSGLTNQPGTSYSTEGYSTTLSLGQFGLNGYYINSSGNSLATAGGVVPVTPVPGIPSNYLIQFTGDSYGGGLSWTPIRRMALSASFGRALSNTLSNSIYSLNNTEVANAQLQYRMRRIGLMAGYTRFVQGVSALGVQPGSANSYFAGISRWFNFF